MGNQNDDSTMINSSIALLQERFRELQRVREKRKEKELLKLFAESDHSSSHIAPSLNLEPGKLTSQPGMADPNRPAQAVDESLLSLGLNSHSRHVDARATKSPANSWRNASSASTSSSSRSFENSDVDTSLHL
ncbi:hypothetical protein K2173_007593 [Erythroxylum novogranatense]|uniref:Uncharacterized protein n=1 Tax=Erythroxylum novogranatense TaxID=1862640 RepID=A0AAV8S8X0_9ROSI|nr:hypothetical protein K2173_007593 [Erythroxylum novogranatense]